MWYNVGMFEILPSACKHDIRKEEIGYAIRHHRDAVPFVDRAGDQAMAFTGPRHAGALERDYIEVYAKETRNGDFIVFHALTATR